MLTSLENVCYSEKVLGNYSLNKGFANSFISTYKPYFTAKVAIYCGK